MSISTAHHETRNQVYGGSVRGFSGTRTHTINAVSGIDYQQHATPLPICGKVCEFLCSHKTKCHRSKATCDIAVAQRELKVLKEQQLRGNLRHQRAFPPRSSSFSGIF